jgi:hypothetical protein
MDWSEDFAAALGAPVEVPLEVPPSAEIDIVVCPHCECTNCEVWNSTNSRMATCPECTAEFMVPSISESSAKAVIIAVTEEQLKCARKV